MVEKVEIAVITRTYAGLEGTRVKAGTRFAVGKEIGGLPVISQNRFLQLKQNKLARAFGEEDTKAAAKYTRPLERRKVIQQPQGNTGSPSAVEVRQSTRRRLKQSESPKPPTQLKGPRNGSQTGQATPASSSAEAQASSKSTSTSSAPKKRAGRGNRQAAPSSASSPSITPVR